MREIDDYARRIAAPRGEMMTLIDPRAGWSRKELLGELHRREEEIQALLGRVGELVMQNSELARRLPLKEQMKLLFPNRSQGVQSE